MRIGAPLATAIGRAGGIGSANRASRSTTAVRYGFGQFKKGVTVPTRVQRKRTKGWRMPSNTVYVGRPTKYGNPYKVGDIHPYALPENLTTPEDREAMKIDAQCAVDLYRLGYATACLMVGEKANPFPELRGKNLACFCPLDQPCHADVLLALANE